MNLDLNVYMSQASTLEHEVWDIGERWFLIKRYVANICTESNDTASSPLHPPMELSKSKYANDNNAEYGL